MGSVENESPRKRRKPSSDENDSSLTDDSEDANKFITVLGPNENELVEILLSKDRTLPIVSLDHTFPGAYGLTYVNRTTGRKRSVSFDDWKNAFLEPPGGWAKRKYQLIFKPKLPPGPYRVESPLPELPEIEKFCFYILNIDEKTKRQSKMSVFCIDAFYFATYSHSTKIVYKINETKVTVYSKDWNEKENKGKKFNTTVKHISIEQDFVLLKSDDQIFDSGPVICEFPCSGSITLCGGYSGEVEPLKECKKSGDLQSSRTAYIKCNNERRGPYYFGNVTSSHGDSGCAVFCPHGLKGMNIGVTNFPDCSYKVAFNKSAVYHPKCMIVPAIDMKKVTSYFENEERKKAEKLAEVEEQFAPGPEPPLGKKARLMEEGGSYDE